MHIKTPIMIDSLDTPNPGISQQKIHVRLFEWKSLIVLLTFLSIFLLTGFWFLRSELLLTINNISAPQISIVAAHILLIILYFIPLGTIGGLFFYGILYLRNTARKQGLINTMEYQTNIDQIERQKAEKITSLYMEVMLERMRQSMYSNTQTLTLDQSSATTNSNSRNMETIQNEDNTIPDEIVLTSLLENK